MYVCCRHPGLDFSGFRIGGTAALFREARRACSLALGFSVSVEAEIFTLNGSRFREGQNGRTTE